MGLEPTTSCLHGKGTTTRAKGEPEVVGAAEVVLILWKSTATCICSAPKQARTDSTDGRVRSTQMLVIHQWAGPSVIAELAPDSTPDRAE